MGTCVDLIDSQGHTQTSKQTKGSFDTLPAGFAGGLDADLDQNVLRGAVLSTVIGGHGQLVHALFAIAQLLRVFDEP